MNTYISIIFKIMDQFRKRALLAPEVSIYINKQITRPLYKPGGYFIFTDLTPGPTSFEITSPIFGMKTVEADIPEAGNGYIMSHIMLNPSKLYPFGGPVTTVAGRITRGKAPASGQQFHMIPADGGELMKIAEDRAEAGNSSIKLFATVNERLLSFPGKYMIKDKDDKKREFLLITQAADKEGQYPLENALTYGHPRATSLLEVIECNTSVDGSFFMALPNVKTGKASVDFIAEDKAGKSIIKTFEILAHRANSLGDIEI